MVDVLVAAGANIDFQNKVIIFFVCFLCVKRLKQPFFLIRHLSTLQAGETALYWATWNHHKDVVKVLVGVGANPNIQAKV